MMNEPIIRLRDGETAVVGYGSLLSRASLERTLKRRYDGPYVACYVEGWRRSWDVAMPNHTFYFVTETTRVYPREILYLNVRPVPHARLNAALFIVTPEELTAMHAREWIYDPVVVTDRLRGVQIEGGDAVMYVAKPSFVRRGATDRHEVAVRASYLRIVEDGLRDGQPGFRAEYLESTDAVPQHLVVDDLLDLERQNPLKRTAV